MFKKLIMWMAVLGMIVFTAPEVMAEKEEVCDECRKVECECDWEEGEEELEEDDREEAEEFGAIEKDVFLFLKKNVPAAVDRLAKLAKDNWEEYEEKIYEAADMIEEYFEALEDKPEAARAWLASVKEEIEIELLVEKIRKTEDAAMRKQLEDKLKVALDKAFDLRLQNRKAELDMLKKEVSEIEAMIEKRKTNKQKIIDRYFRDLLAADDEDDELAW